MLLHVLISKIHIWMYKRVYLYRIFFWVEGFFGDLDNNETNNNNNIYLHVWYNVSGYFNILYNAIKFSEGKGRGKVVEFEGEALNSHSPV